MLSLKVRPVFMTLSTAYSSSGTLTAVTSPPQTSISRASPNA